MAGVSFCFKEPLDCVCPVQLYIPVSLLAVMSDSVLTSTGCSRFADGRVTEAWTALCRTHTGTVTLTQMGKRGIHIFWHTSLGSANPNSPLGLCSLHQTHLQGKDASTKGLSWTCLNNSSAQDHQPPLPNSRCILDFNPRCILDLNEA